MPDQALNSKQILFETILITVISLSGMWFWPAAKTLFALIPVFYLLVERRLRKRSWQDLGFRVRTFWFDLQVNWLIFIISGFFIQPAVVLWAKSGFPEYIDHIQARLPFDSDMYLLLLLPMLAFSLIGEEMTYRVLIQGRLSTYFGNLAAIAMASLLFGLAHFSPGPTHVVLTDIGLIMFSSVLYSMLFARSSNIWLVWLAHLIGDVLGLLTLNFSQVIRT